MLRSPAFTILYQDRFMVAVDKPGGLLVHRTALSRDRVALAPLLAERLGQRVFGVHRLDRATSGVLIFALDSESARRFHQQLGDALTRKRYLGLARGVTPERFSLDRPLTAGAQRKRSPARTDGHRLAILAERHSWLELVPYTGRRHQIRRHLAHAAHQLIGDTTYGKGRMNRWFREQYGLPRLVLHSWRLELTHPYTGEPLRLEAPLAEDLRVFVQRLAGFREDLPGVGHGAADRGEF